MLLRLLACLTALACSASAQGPRPAPVGAAADYHVHVKGDLTLDDALRRSRQDGITYGIAINGGVGFPTSSDAGLEPFLAEMRGKPVFTAFQAEGREWVTLFTPKALGKFDYVFTDSMTWTDDSGKRMRLWIPEDVGTITDPEKFMDMLVDRATRIFAEEPIDLYVNPTYIPDQLSSRVRQALDARAHEADRGRAGRPRDRHGDQQPPPDPQRGVHQAGEAGRREVRLRHQQRGGLGSWPQRVLRRDDQGMRPARRAPLESPGRGEEGGPAERTQVALVRGNPVPRQITLRDIGKQLGLSAMTVSLALRDSVLPVELPLRESLGPAPAA